jgi:hypothetical protein
METWGDNLIDKYTYYGVSDENIKIINGEVCLNRLGVIQFFIGQVASVSDLSDFSDEMKITVMNMYKFCDSVADGHTFFSGEFEGYKIYRETFTCGELVGLLHSIYNGDTITMGEFHDIKDRLIALIRFIYPME